MSELQRTALTADYENVLRTAAQWVSLVSDGQASPPDREVRARFLGFDTAMAAVDPRPASGSVDDLGHILDANARASGSGRPTHGRSWSWMGLLIAGRTGNVW